MSRDAAVAELVEAIRNGPVVAKTLAIFDLDGTLIDGYTAGAIYSHRVRNLEVGPFELVRTVRRMLGPTRRWRRDRNPVPLTRPSNLPDPYALPGASPVPVPVPS